MAPLRTALCLALLGLTAAASYQYGSSGYSTPKYSSTYQVPQPSSGYGAPQPSSGYGAPQPSSGYGTPKYVSSYHTPSYGGSKPSGRYGGPHRRGGAGTSLVRPGISSNGGFPRSSVSTSRKSVPFKSGSSGRFPVQRSQGGSKYYASWQDGSGPDFSWDQANRECLARGMHLVSLTSPQKNEEVTRLMLGAPKFVEFFWTSGRLQGNRFVWGDKHRTQVCFRNENCFQNWSHTGGANLPQPDNNEGGENCLAMLNAFYQDGQTWHDIACHHLKHFVCERQ